MSWQFDNESRPLNSELGKAQQEIKEGPAEFANREMAPYDAEWYRGEARFPVGVFENWRETS
jgi:hypothetical protein